MGRHNLPNNKYSLSKFIHYEDSPRLPSRWQRLQWALRPYLLAICVFAQIAIIALFVIWAKDPAGCSVVWS